MLLLERNREIQSVIDPRVAVTVFSRMVADDFPMLQSERLQIQQDCGSERSKSERQAPRCVILVRESENGRDAQSFDGCGQR